MTKQFTVKYGNETRTIEGPDDATQEQAQQISDTHRDMSGDTGRAGILGTGILGGDFGAKVGRLTSSFAQGGAEMVGGPAQLLGMTPGPNYQAAESEPRDTSENIAKFAGATLPLGPLGGALGTLAKGNEALVGGDASVAEFLAKKGLPFKGKIQTNPAWPKVAAIAPHALGAAGGASAPADSPTQRAINTGIGAVTGGIGRGAATPAKTALDRLAGVVGGSTIGHLANEFIGGGHWSLPWLAGSIGAAGAPAVERQLSGLLSKFPPNVVARFMANMANPVVKAIADEYNAMYGGSDGQSQGK